MVDKPVIARFQLGSDQYFKLGISILIGRHVCHIRLFVYFQGLPWGYGRDVKREPVASCQCGDLRTA